MGNPDSRSDVTGQATHAVASIQIEVAASNNGHGPTPVSEVKSGLPGLRNYQGRDGNIDDVREVIQLLISSDIPSCIVDVNALRYYGAGRVTWEWDVCVPVTQLKVAEQIFKENEQYEPAEPAPMLFESFRHLNPTFKRKDAGFFFILTPSDQCYIDPRPEYCELSKNQIPYPQMPQFARSLLVMQRGADLEDFIDGMDLDEAWGEQHIDFGDLRIKGAEFTAKQNMEFRARDLGQYNEKVDYRKTWNHSVQTKSRRIEPLKQGRYKTRWRRIKNDKDPREKEREHV